MTKDIKQYINADDALARMAGMKKIYAKTLKMFLEDAEYTLVEAAMAAKKYADAAEHLHTLKGVAGNLSLTALYDECEPLIQALRGGTADEALLARFRQVYQDTRDCVEELLPTLA